MVIFKHEIVQGKNRSKRRKYSMSIRNVEIPYSGAGESFCTG